MYTEESISEDSDEDEESRCTEREASVEGLQDLKLHKAKQTLERIRSQKRI